MSKIVFIPGFVSTVTTIVIDSTPIVGGASGRILFQNAANQISESPNFTYLAGIFNITKTATHQAQFSFDVNNYFGIKATSTGATELSATGTAPKFLFNADVDAQTNNVYATKIGVGTITPAAFLEVLGTTQQAMLAYNASNHLGITIGSTGNATYALTGTSPVNIFNQYIGVGKTPTNPIDIAVNVTGSGNGANISFKNSHSAGWSSTKVINDLNDYCYYGIVGSTVATYGAIVARDTVMYTGRPIVFAVDGNNSIKFATGAGSLQRMTITGAGDVGINRTNPNAKFHVIATTEQIRVGYDASNFSSFTVGATGNLLIGLTGTTPRTTFSQGINVQGTIRSNGYTVATLPAGVIGDQAYVTDALAPIFLGIIAGGGAVVTPVFYNGANWIAQ